MAGFNFGSGFTSGSYGYTNGAFSSSTSFVNGVAYTQNILNLGGSGCSSGPTYCQEGFSFYVPCVKNITRGQNVCFQFYIADKIKQDTLDIGDFGNSPDDCGLDGLTVQMTGPFGCAYGSYSYPDDIKSLQYDEFSEIACDGFDGNIYHLDLGYLEFNPDNNSLIEIADEDVCQSEDGYNVNITGFVGEFFEGERPHLIANDSTTHIFVGWTTPEILSGLCKDFTIGDLVFSTDNELIFDEPIDKDYILYAIYRPRKKYEIKVSFENRHSFFMFMVDGKHMMLSDKVRDIAVIREGYHFLIECCPLIAKFRDGQEYTYNFLKWPDGVVQRTREYFADDNLFKDGELRLLAFCDDKKTPLNENQNLRNEVNQTPNDFSNNLPIEKIVKDIEVEYSPSDYIVDYKGVRQSYGQTENNYIILSKDGYLIFDAGIAEEDGLVDLRMIMTIDTSNIKEHIVDKPISPIPDGEESDGGIMLLSCDAMDRFYENNFAYQDWDKKHNHDKVEESEEEIPDEEPEEDDNTEQELPKPVLGQVFVKNGNKVIIASITSKEDTKLIFDFKGCEDGVFEITTTFDELFIDNICVYERIIINKGKVELCLSPEDTLKFYTGILNMNGVISVCGNTFGMDSVQIGMVNKLNPISIVTK